MSSGLTAFVEGIPARHVDELQIRLREAVQRELVARMGDDLESFSAVTLEQLYRCLVTGDFGQLGPPEPRPDDEDDRERADHAEICRRIRLVRSLDTDEKRAEEMKRCERDPVYFCNNWLWMADPRPQAEAKDAFDDEDDESAGTEIAQTTVGRPKLMTQPIRLWDRQTEAIHWILKKLKQQRCGLGKKSRDVGFSVICCALGVWFWRFRPGTSVGYGSRKEPLVDNIGDLDSLFEKIRFIIRRMPAWMLPRNYKEKDHSKEMLIMNPENGSALKGEGGKNLGNAGRSTIFFMDEFSLVEHQERVHHGLKSNTNTIIFFGRSAGPQTYFHELEARGVYEVFRFPWYYDPRKLDDPAMVGDPEAPSAWRDAMVAAIGAAKFAEIYACDDDEAVENVIVPVSWVQAAVDIRLQPEGAAVAGIDVADGGTDESVLCIRRGPVPTFKTWDGIEAKTLARPVASICEREGVDYAYFDAQGVGQSFGGEFARLVNRVSPDGVEFSAFSFMGFHGQLPASKFRVFEDFEHDGRTVQTCRDRFENQLTEQWWAMRLRFERTFEYVQWQRQDEETRGPAPHDSADLISIEDDDVLRKQLKRKWFRNSKGKIQLQDKRELSSSPDRADALAMTECVALQTAESMPEARRAGVLKSRFHSARF